MSRTSHVLVPVACCAMGLFALCLAGCGKESEKPAADPSSPASYMKDPAFRQQLKDRRKDAVSIGERREQVTARQNEMVSIMGEKLKTADRAKIVAALESNAEWQSLAAKAKELDAEFMKHHNETLRIVRERISPKGKRISK